MPHSIFSISNRGFRSLILIISIFGACILYNILSRLPTYTESNPHSIYIPLKDLLVQDLRGRDVFNESVYLNDQKLARHINSGTPDNISPIPLQEFNRKRNDEPPVNAPKPFQSDFSRITDFRDIPWSKFVKMGHTIPRPQNLSFGVNYNLPICENNVLEKLNAGLNKEDFEFCSWAFKTGGVKVGKSYGKLSREQKAKYERLNCDGVADGKNPSCNEGWGDEKVLKWRSQRVPSLCDDPAATSKINCFESNSKARYCEFHNVMLDFSKMHKVRRSDANIKDSRSWDRDFMRADCGPSSPKDIDYFSIYTNTPSVREETCDFVFTETVLAYNHDNIRNIGHTVSDFMNVWLILWLAQLADRSQDVTFFNIDALRGGSCFDDEPNQFFRHYELAFRRIVKAISYAPKKVCFKHLVMQPKPLMLFAWDGWTQDMPCTFAGPSSLFQRFNRHIRLNYGLLSTSKPLKHSSDSSSVTSKYMSTNHQIQVLLIIRKGKSGDGQIRPDRYFKNTEEIVSSLSTIPNIKLVAVDLAEYSFEDQIRIVANSSMMVGMHGAGIAHGLHLPLGTRFCCGVIEIFLGEFLPLRFYGNMIRRMGHYYNRLDLNGSSSLSQSNIESMSLHDAARVPVHMLKGLVVQMIGQIENKPTCLLPNVISNPTFLN